MSDTITVTLTRHEARSLAHAARITLDWVDPSLTTEPERIAGDKAAGLAAIDKLNAQLKEV